MILQVPCYLLAGLSRAVEDLFVGSFLEVEPLNPRHLGAGFSITITST